MTISLRLVTGWQVPFRIAPGPVVVSVLVAGVVSAVAGWFPARAAARLDVRQHSVD